MVGFWGSHETIFEMPNRIPGSWGNFQRQRPTRRSARRSERPPYTTHAPNDRYGVSGSIPIFWCCHREFSSMRALREHQQTSAHHCGLHSEFIFPDHQYTAEFQEPKKQTSSKQLPCWGCNDWKHFPNFSEMLRHIENNECRSHWTIRQINALAEECNGFSKFIIPGRQDWFRKGAPPLKPQKFDYDQYNDCYLCSNCDEPYENMSELKEHLQERECSYDYPSVLRCPSCPKSGFERLSDLVQHLEQQHCQTGRANAWMAGLFQSLQRKFEDLGVQRRIEMDHDEFLVGERRPRRPRFNTRRFYDDESWFE